MIDGVSIYLFMADNIGTEKNAHNREVSAT